MRILILGASGAAIAYLLYLLFFRFAALLEGVMLPPSWPRWVAATSWPALWSFALFHAVVYFVRAYKGLPFDPYFSKATPGVAIFSLGILALFLLTSLPAALNTARVVDLHRSYAGNHGLEFSVRGPRWRVPGNLETVRHAFVASPDGCWFAHGLLATRSRSRGEGRGSTRIFMAALPCKAARGETKLYWKPGIGRLHTGDPEFLWSCPVKPDTKFSSREPGGTAEVRAC